MFRNAVINAIRESWDDDMDTSRNPEFYRGQLELALNLLGHEDSDSAIVALDAAVRRDY